MKSQAVKNRCDATMGRTNSGFFYDYHMNGTMLKVYIPVEASHRQTTGAAKLLFHVLELQGASNLTERFSLVTKHIFEAYPRVLFHIKLGHLVSQGLFRNCFSDTSFHSPGMLILDSDIHNYLVKIDPALSLLN